MTRKNEKYCLQHKIITVKTIVTSADTHSTIQKTESQGFIRHIYQSRIHIQIFIMIFYLEITNYLKVRKHKKEFRMIFD